MLSAAVLLVVVGPALGGAICLRRSRTAGAAPAARAASLGAAGSLVGAVVASAGLAAGSETTLSVVGVLLVSFDGLAAVVTCVVATVGLSVVAFAGRNLSGDPRAAGFLVAASLVLAATQLMAVAARPSVLVLGWVITSGAVVAMLGFRGDRRSRRAAHQARRGLAVADLCLLTAAAVLTFQIGDPTFATLDREVAELSAAVLVLPLGVVLDVSLLVALLLVGAAAARAGQLLAPRWLTITVEAPTPASALLHAGVVNAGAVLLVRFNPVLAAEPVAAWALVISSAATIAAVAGATALRKDVKGSLALSTSAQMGFMLLAVAVGAPAAAIAHLAGHALYKSERFLSAGATIAADARARRARGPATHALRPGTARAGGAAVALLVVGGSLAVGPGPLHGAGGWLIAITAGIAITQGVAAWLRRSALSPPATAGFAVAGAVAALVVLLAGAAVVEVAISPVVDTPGTWPSAPLALVIVGMAVTATRVLHSHSSTGPWLSKVLAAVAHPSSATSGRRRVAPAPAALTLEVSR